MQCPYVGSIALADEEGGCSVGAGTDDRGASFDPSASFPAVAAAAQIVSAVVDVLGRGDLRLAGRMLSFDQRRYRLDMLRIAPNPGCGGHRRLAPDEYVSVPVADYVVAELAALVASKLGTAAPVTLAVEREIVDSVTCARCGRVEAVHRALVAWRRAAGGCPTCGSADAIVNTYTVLPPNVRLSEAGIVPGKALRGHARDRWLYVIPVE